MRNDMKYGCLLGSEFIYLLTLLYVDIKKVKVVY